MIKFVYLILYIIILFILLFIIYNYYYIIEKYVDIDITHFGDFKPCVNNCSNGQQLIGCKGLSQGSCEDCPKGTAGTGGICRRCTGKYYSSSRGSTSCSLCNTNGKRVNSNNKACELCPAGTAGTGGGCYYCYANTYSSKEGSTTCSLCEGSGNGVISDPTAYYSNIGCGPCPAGTYGYDGSCRYCTGNTYSSQEGSSTCYVCEGGNGRGVNIGNTTCELCPAGKYEINGICRRCPRNTYSSIEGSTECSMCPTGQRSNSNRTACF